MSHSETDIGRELEDEGRRYAAQRELADSSPDAIERQIDATRADLRATIAELERRLSLERLLDLTVGRVRERGGEFAGNLTDAATKNPVPLLLTAVGVGWMMLTNRRSDSAAAPDAATRAHEAVDSARETLEHSAESLRSGASRAAAATRRQVDGARERMDRMLDEQPLMLGMLGLAAGAVIGAMLPATEREDRWLGDMRDTAVKTAARKTRERADAARHDEDELQEPTAPYATESGAADRPTERPH